MAEGRNEPIKLIFASSIINKISIIILRNNRITDVMTGYVIAQTREVKLSVIIYSGKDSCDALEEK